MAGPNYTVMPNDWQTLEDIISDLSSRIIDEDASFSDYILKDGSRAYTGTGVGFKDEDDMSSDSATATASQQSIKAYVDTAISSFDEIVLTGKLTAGSFASPIDVTDEGQYGFELHYSGNDYDVTGIRSRAQLKTTDTDASATGGLFQAANNDGINVGVLNGFLAEAIGKSSTTAATIAMMRAGIVNAEWGAFDTVTQLNTFHVRVHSRNASGAGSFGDGYGIYIENEAVGGNGQALNAGIYFKGTNLSGGNNAFTYGIDFSGGTYTTAEIKLKNGGTIGDYINITDEANGYQIDGKRIVSAYGSSKTNVFIGHSAGNFTMTGIHNVAWGAYVLDANTTGSHNIGMGSAALTYNTTGDYNVGIGRSALSVNTTGSWNVGIGDYALFLNQTGIDNIAIGASSLLNSTSNENVAIGIWAGNYLTTGSSNIFIGFNAGKNQTTNSNLLIVDNQDRSSAANEITNSLIYGVFNATPANQTLRFNAAITIPYALGAGAITGTSLGLSSYLDMVEMAEPDAPAGESNTLRLYTEAIHGFSFLKYLDDTGMKREFMRDSMILVYNDSGDTILANRVVYASGSSDNVPTVELAKSNSSATMPAVGVTVEEIADEAYGRVIQIGILENVDTSAFDEGDVLYVHDTVAGVVRKTPPTTPNLTQEIGTVLVSHADTGTIQIVARGLTGDEYGTRQNDFYIGDGITGSKVLHFNSETDASITWDETKFDFGASPVQVGGYLYLTSGVSVAYFYHSLDDGDTGIVFGNNNFYFSAGGLKMMIFTEDEKAQDEVVVNVDGLDVDFRCGSDNVAGIFQVNAVDDTVNIGDGTNLGVFTNYVQIGAAGNLTMNGTAILDHSNVPNKPKIYSQADEPDIGNNTTAFWTDTDDGKYYLILDIGGTQKKVELV
jgi:hypothetical protein